MSNNIETPEFWEQVKQEYEASERPFICEASILFDSQWKSIDQKSIIQKYAAEFINLEMPPHTRIRASVKPENRVMFFHKDGEVFNRRPVRLAFLIYMIQKAKNNLRV